MALINAETKVLLLAAAQNGVDLNTMSDYAGISKTKMEKLLHTYYRAQQLVDHNEQLTEEEQEVFDLFTQCRKLRADIEVGSMGVLLRNASNGHAQSARWILENRFGYGGKEKESTVIEITTREASTEIDYSEFDSLSAALQHSVNKHKQFELEQQQPGDDEIVDAELVEDSDEF